MRLSPLARDESQAAPLFLPVPRLQSNSPLVIWLLLGFGLLLRLIPYLANRSLWMDESFLALNIIKRSFFQLSEPLSFDQGAPIGFLLGEKLLVQLLGSSELVLRLLPLLAGCGALVLFYKLTDTVLDARVVPVAVCLFATCQSLIYYSSEVKQYAVDVFIVLLVYLMARRIETQPLHGRQIALFGIVGATVLWFSHPVLFVLAGVGLTLLLTCIRERDWGKLGRWSICFVAWGMSLGVCYAVSLRHLGANDALLGYWDDSFMPFPPTTGKDYLWFGATAGEIWGQLLGFALYPGGLVWTLLGFVLALLGGRQLYRRERKLFWQLIAPILCTLLASGIHKYPFRGRLLLFITPVLLLLIAQGIQHLWCIRLPRFMGMQRVLIGLLLLLSVLRAADDTLAVQQDEGMKPIVQHVQAHYKPGDHLYLYYGAWPAFTHYAERSGFAPASYSMSPGPDASWDPVAAITQVQEVDALRGRARVWVLFSHGLNDDQAMLLGALDRLGTRRETYTVPNAAAYLYNLSLPANVSQ